MGKLVFCPMVLPYCSLPPSLPPSHLHLHHVGRMRTTFQHKHLHNRDHRANRGKLTVYAVFETAESAMGHFENISIDTQTQEPETALRTGKSVSAQLIKYLTDENMHTQV